MHLELQQEQLLCLSLICSTQEVKTLPTKYGPTPCHAHSSDPYYHLPMPLCMLNIPLYPPLPSPHHSSCRAAKHLVNWSGLVDSLEELTLKAHTVGSLVESLLRGLVKEGLRDEVIPAVSAVLLGIVSLLCLRDGFAEELIG